MSARQPEPEWLDKIRARAEAATRCPEATEGGGHIWGGRSFSHAECELCRFTRPRGERAEETAALLAEIDRLTAVIADRDRGVQIVNDEAVRRAAYEAMDGERRAGESRAAVLHKRIADLDDTITRLRAEAAASRAAVLDEARKAAENATLKYTDDSSHGQAYNLGVADAALEISSLHGVAMLAELQTMDAAEGVGFHETTEQATSRAAVLDEAAGRLEQVLADLALQADGEGYDTEHGLRLAARVTGAARAHSEISRMAAEARAAQTGGAE